MTAQEAADAVSLSGAIGSQPTPSGSDGQPLTSPAPGATTFDPYRQADHLQSALTSDKIRVAFFLGAGCPMSIRIGNGDESEPLIPDVDGLTKLVYTALIESKDYRAAFDAVRKRVVDSGNGDPNIEEFLTFVRALKEVAGAAGIDGLTGTGLAALDAEICRVIVETVRRPLPESGTPYHGLASWIGAIPRQYPVEIFTSNYDLLTEQALERQRVPYFDGFVGTDRPFFDLASMEQDTLPSRWVRMWKIHGSINWRLTPEGNVERCEPAAAGESHLIHPSHLKYDQSRRMPYLAMLDRLRSFLGGGQAILVTCGYSFSDQHVNDVILQGLAGNAAAACFALLFGARSAYPEAVASAKRRPNLNILAADGAVLGMREGRWTDGGVPSHFLDGVAVRAEPRPAGESGGPCTWLLGDFACLGRFLEYEIAGRDQEGIDANGG